MKDYASNLDQASRLAALPVSPFVDIREDEIVSRPPNGFRMPSMTRVREHDARLMLNGSRRDSNGDCLPSNEGYEKDAYGSHVQDEPIFTACALPSTRSRSYVRDSLRSMGMSWND